MITGRFGDMGELFFEIELLAGNGDILSVEALLDTGFTTGWLAMNSQDIQYLEWPLIERTRTMQTARGEEYFDIYAGTIILDQQQHTIPVVAAEDIPDNLLGLQWLQTRRLIVDLPSNLLTLG